MIQQFTRLSSKDIENIAALYASIGQSRISDNIDGLKMIASLMPIYMVKIEDEHYANLKITRIKTNDLEKAKKMYNQKEYDCIMNHIPLNPTIIQYLK